ncbi:DUF721 domain-containing protein [Legionella septentrionalis]|nr:DUF721 domain-containing protein [Legionella septentrionalis]RUR16525.1 DUF721 domain-containing protein [Legionella septentrionalis]
MHCNIILQTRLFFYLYWMFMRPINQCLNPKLAELCQQALRSESLKDKVSQHLPPLFQKHCSIAGFNKGCLILLVDDAIWATQLRFLLPELRDKLRQEAGIYQLASIKLLLNPAEQIQIKTKTPVPHMLSLPNKMAIMHAAEQCSFLPLKNALYKLAKHSNHDAETTQEVPRLNACGKSES